MKRVLAVSAITLTWIIISVSSSYGTTIDNDNCLDEQAREHLRELMYKLGQSDVNIVHQTSNLLYEMGAPGVDFFIEALKYYPKEVRRQAAEVLFATDIPLSRKQGVILLNDPCPEVRIVLAHSLSHFKHEDRRYLMWELWRDPVADIAAATVTYFGEVGGNYEARHILESMHREDAINPTRFYPEVINLATACHWALSRIVRDDPNYFMSQIIKTPQDLKAVINFWSVRLNQLSDPKEIFAAGESAISWPYWSEIQLARTRYLVAEISESAVVGRLARQKYAEFLKLHPDFGMNMKIAYRLGELHNSVLLHETKRDLQKAKYYYELTLTLCDNIQKDHPGVYYEALKAHVGLAYLADDISDMKMHWQAIYDSDPNKAAILPDTEFLYDPEEDRNDHLKGLRAQVAHIRKTAAKGLVSTYHLSDLDTALKYLYALMEEYPDDKLIIELAEKKCQQLQGKLSD